MTPLTLIALYLGLSCLSSGLLLAIMIRYSNRSVRMNNQCDGCIRGLPITKLGFHRTETELFGCTRARYQMALEPKSRDTWAADWNESRRKDVPFVSGDAA